MQAFRDISAFDKNYSMYLCEKPKLNTGKVNYFLEFKQQSTSCHL